MGELEQILREFGETGVETSFVVEGRTYRVFAYPSPGRDRARVRWNLYEVEDGRGEKIRGLTFGIADGVREAMADVVEAARQHARSGEAPGPVRRPLTFRPTTVD